MNVKTIDPGKKLPPNLVFKPTTTYLWRIGLCLERPSNVKRRFLHIPLYIFVIMIFQVIKSLYFIQYLEDNESLSIKLGNIGFFLKMNFHFNMGSNLFFYLAVYSQVVYYYNYRTGVEPTFLRVFNMMAGQTTPRSVGLTNDKQILSLIRKTRLMFTLFAKLVDISVYIFGHILVYTPYLLFCTLKETIIYGIPNNFIYMSTVYYSMEINMFQVLYFYLMCVFIKVKVKSIHSRAEQLIKTRNYSNIGSVLKQLNAVFAEVNDYNKTFWSKFLVGFWVTIGSMAMLFLYCVLFTKMPFVHRMIMMYNVFILVPLFLFVIFTAASVNFEANNSYKVLTRLNLAYIKERNINRKFKLKNMLKVTSDF